MEDLPDWTTSPFIMVRTKEGWKPIEIGYQNRDQILSRDGKQIVSCGCWNLDEMSKEQCKECPLRVFCAQEDIKRNSTDCRFVRYHGLLENIGGTFV